jgi:hypothetical protein
MGVISINFWKYLLIEGRVMLYTIAFHYIDIIMWCILEFLKVY